jgi:hypothetical protein
MEKAKLNKIFSKTFDLQEWLIILKEVFGAKQLLTQPKPILLNNNDRAKSATELGSFATSDDRIIGLYYVIVNDDIWLERNKVGLRELLRNIFRYDVDGALVVFEQGEKWRLSFISEIKVLNDEGEVVEQATEPKRYTYLLGVDEKVKTPSERLAKLVGKTLALNDILNAFSVEALNEEFYKIISEYFYQLVGGTVGSGKSAKSYEPKLKLPIPVENHQTYQEFVVRLIGRTIFCWFLKMKKSDDGVSLVPEGLLSSEAVKNNNGYYHNILERLFFQTLNTKIDERVDGLPNGCEKIPFLNGGLFEPNYDDYYKPNRVTGISEHINTLKIEDNWFFGLFTELEKYNFTIDENSVTDVEVSVDPEMLGRIFENLLAEIDPDSGETARKATGSFYTPREIVDYMATESLVQYIHNKTLIEPAKIRPVFRMTEEPDPTFTKNELEGILDALDKVKILDPACGSGAFPMGILQKIVQALQKLDANADWWKKRQVERISNPIVRKALKEKLDSSGVEYARKIGVIQNSLYGVDIQPIAAEISKLRCFLTLIVDENIDETKQNRGIEPLPNLEFKFVTADTLQKLPEQNAQRGLFDNYEEQERLKELRAQYLQSYGSEKETIKKEFISVQSSMFNKDLHLFTSTNSRTYKLSTWNPFSHDKADWFDPQWMFGIESFDVVIGNPPFINISNLKPASYRELLKSTYYSAKNKADTYAFFIERSFDFLEKNGLSSFIVPQTWKATSSFSKLREIIFKRHTLQKILDLEFGVFAAIVKPMVIQILNKNIENYKIPVYNDEFKEKITIDIQEVLNNPSLSINTHTSEIEKEIFKRIEEESVPLENFVKFSRGIKTSNDNRFIHKEQINQECKKVYRGKNIKAYQLNWAGEYIWYRPDLMKEKVGSVSYTKEFFEVPEKIVTQRVNSSMQLLCAYDCEQNYFLDTTNVSRYDSIQNGISLKAICCLLNSKLINFWYCNNYLMPTIGLYELHTIPIKLPKNQNPFINFADYIFFLSKNVKKKIINLVENSHLQELFKDVIDAMVMEIYFPDEFKQVNIEFIKYAERDFESIEGKPEPEQIEIINKAYQKLNEKDNEIRNNLKLMDIKLADIVLPIKSAK